MQNNFIYVTRKNNDLPLVINLSSILFFQPYSGARTRIFLVDGTIIDVNQSFGSLCERIDCFYRSDDEK